MPKVNDPVNLEQYRLISLVGAMYKIISKLFTNRIKKMSPKVIDKSQTAFLNDRGLLDSILVANEVV